MNDTLENLAFEGYRIKLVGKKIKWGKRKRMGRKGRKGRKGREEEGKSG